MPYLISQTVLKLCTIINMSTWYVYSYNMLKDLEWQTCLKDEQTSISYDHQFTNITFLHSFYASVALLKEAPGGKMWPLFSPKTLSCYCVLFSSYECKNHALCANSAVRHMVPYKSYSYMSAHIMFIKLNVNIE